MNPALFTLGLYQLENLISARPTFHFFDVRVHPQSVANSRVEAVLSTATVVSANHLRGYLDTREARQDDPIVLLCEDARLSARLGAELEAAGYQQVYIVDGGLDGLLREATSSG